MQYVNPIIDIAPWSRYNVRRLVKSSASIH